MVSQRQSAGVVWSYKQLFGHHQRQFPLHKCHTSQLPSIFQRTTTLLYSEKDEAVSLINGTDASTRKPAMGSCSPGRFGTKSFLKYSAMRALYLSGLAIKRPFGVWAKLICVIDLEWTCFKVGPSSNKIVCSKASRHHKNSSRLPLTFE